MSKSSGERSARVENERGTTQSYIVGFILSLVFTAIPYELVVKKTITGTTLLATILAFAVLQMIVQVLFFLHLGRERKPRWQLYFFLATIFGILTVVLGSIIIMSHLHHNMTPDQVSLKLTQDEGIAQVNGEKTGACEGRDASGHTSHFVTISNGKVSPLDTAARLCDTLTFINQDDTTRDIAFGPHAHHDIYGGETEVTVHKGHPETITLNQAGTFAFHDHLDPTTAGHFTVAP